MSYEQPEDRRARRLAAVRAERGSEERARQIAELEAEKAKPKVRARSATPSVRKSPESSSTFFGYPWAEWFEMRDAGRARLNTCAAERQLIAYGDLWAAIAETVGRELGSQHLALPRLLRDIGDVAIKDGELATERFWQPEIAVPQRPDSEHVRDFREIFVEVIRRKLGAHERIGINSNTYRSVVTQWKELSTGMIVHQEYRALSGRAVVGAAWRATSVSGLP